MKQLGYGLGVALAFVGTAHAGPSVQVGPFGDSVPVTQLPGTGAMIEIFRFDQGGGSGWLRTYPYVFSGIGFGADVTMGVYDASTYDSGTWYDGITSGQSIGPADSNDWRISGPFDSYDPLAIENGVRSCLTCEHVFDWDFGGGNHAAVPTGVHFFAARWADLSSPGNYWYAWIAISAVTEPLPDSCFPDGSAFDPCPEPPTGIGRPRGVNLEILAYAVAGEINTPITVGGGLCPADVDFNARYDFFDVTTYLALFSAGDAAADFTGEGDINFQDVLGFIAAYNDGCSF